jgi:hypothetical protein
MRMDEPILFHVKNKLQRVLLELAGFDDDGIRMKSPMGGTVPRELLGETLIDPDGGYYVIKKMTFQSDLIWIAQILDAENVAS